jgi:hypothetical protein
MSFDESTKKEAITEPAPVVEDEKAALDDLDQYYADRKVNLTTIAEYGHSHNPDVADLTAHEFIGNSAGGMDIEEDLKIIADMSILEEDDPTMPALTLRALVIGLVRIHLFLHDNFLGIPCVFYPH